MDCAPGEYWVEAADPYDWGFCLVAPEGYFSPNPKTVGIDGLTQCPDGKTTEEPGAASEDLCKGTVTSPQSKRSCTAAIVTKVSSPYDWGFCRIY